MASVGFLFLQSLVRIQFCRRPSRQQLKIKRETSMTPTTFYVVEDARQTLIRDPRASCSQHTSKATLYLYPLKPHRAVLSYSRELSISLVEVFVIQTSFSIASRVFCPVARRGPLRPRQH